MPYQDKACPPRTTTRTRHAPPGPPLCHVTGGLPKGLQHPPSMWTTYLPPGGVDQHCVGPHQRQLRRPQHAFGAGAERAVEADDVAVGQEVLQVRLGGARVDAEDLLGGRDLELRAC